MKLDFNPITGNLDLVGGDGGGSNPATGELFYGATPISGGTYWAKIAQFNIAVGSNIGHNLVAMLHLMRCNAMPYSHREHLGVKEATIFLSLCSIDTGGNLQEMVFDSSYGILQDEIKLIKTAHTKTLLTYELYARVYSKDRYFFTCRWNQLDKANIGVVPGKESDELVGGFDPGLPVFYPVSGQTSEYSIVNETMVQINHLLNKYPSVTIIDNDGNQVLADVHFDSRSQITITFTESFSGTVVLN